MNEPDCPSKRRKMDEASSGGPSTSVDIFNGQDQKFSSIRKRLGFIDHTPMIKIFFEITSETDFTPAKIFVSAPSHFGKSSNMDMTKRFFIIKDDGTIADKLEERHMYATFKDTAIMKNTDTTDRHILEKHFCAHPVVFVDFKAPEITSYNAAIDHVFEAIKKAYTFNKEFLMNKLSEESEKAVCALWCSAKHWTDLAPNNIEIASGKVKHGLENLIESLFIAHKEKRVLLLIDECDAVLSSALMHRVPSEETYLNNVKAQEERMKSLKEGIKAQEERIKAQEERMKAQEERIKALEERMKTRVENIARELDSIAVSVKLKMSQKKESDSDITRLLNDIIKSLSSNKTLEELGSVARSLLNIVEPLSCCKKQEKKLEAIVAELKDKSSQEKLEKEILQAKLEKERLQEKLEKEILQAKLERESLQEKLEKEILQAKLDEHNHLEGIAKFMENVLCNATKGVIAEKLQGALLTGISYISGIGFSQGITVEAFRFLDDKPNYENNEIANLISECYGLTDTQLDDLLKNLLKNKKWKKSIATTKKRIRDYYNGYYTRRGKRILSLWSVLHYLTFNNKKATYAQMGYIGQIYKKSFSNPLVGEIVLNLINGGKASFDYVENVSLADFVYLRDKGVEGETSKNIFFSLLMEVGFLANVPRKSPTGGEGEKVRNEEDDQKCPVVVIIPNEEIKNVFQHMMEVYSIPYGPFKLAVMLPCADALHNVRLTCLLSDYQILYKEHLKEFHEKLENLFEGFKVYKDNELNESGLQSLLWFAFTYQGKYKVISEYQIGVRRLDLFLKDTKEEFYIIFELKLNRGDWKHCSSHYALKQIKGEEGGSNVNVTVNFENKNFLLVGLSMNKEGKASICVQSSKDEHPILVSKTEQHFLCYHNYYKECYDLINDKMIEVPKAT